MTNNPIPTIPDKPMEEGYENANKEVYDLLHKIVGSFDRFNFLNPSHVLIVMKRKGKSSWVANIRKLPECIKPYLPLKHILLTISMLEWNMMSESKKTAVIFHELLHLAFHEGKYKMVRHDVQDFKEMVTKLGLDYEHADILLTEIKAKDTDRLTENEVS